MQPTTEPKGFNKNPLFYAFTAFAIGIALAELSVLTVWLIVSAAAVVATLLLSKRNLSGVPLLTVFIALGAVSYQLSIPGPMANSLSALLDSGRIPSDQPLEIEGRVLGSPQQA